MGRITVVNSSNGMINSAIVNTGVVYSGHNHYSPFSYYHHEAVHGTSYIVTANWHIAGLSSDFKEFDGETLGWYIGGGVVTLVSVVATVLSFGTLAEAAAAEDISYFAAVAKLSGLAKAGLIIGTIGTAGGLGVTAAQAIREHLKTTNRDVSEVWGGEDRIFEFTGAPPLIPTEFDESGKPTKWGPPAAESRDTEEYKLQSKELSWTEFDKKRREGRIFQADHHNQLLENTLLLRSDRIHRDGIYPSRIYKIFLGDTEHLLMAGEDEGDGAVYLKRSDAREVKEDISSCYWQFIPFNEPGLTGWLICDRRFGRFLCWRDGQLLQYQSEDLKVRINRDGVASFVEGASKPDAVWKLPNKVNGKRAIEVTSGEVCVTGRTDYDYPIYARKYGSDDVIQDWRVVPQ